MTFIDVIYQQMQVDLGNVKTNNDCLFLIAKTNCAILTTLLQIQEELQEKKNDLP